jgi:CPA1 family monovalent cation:H+ antiporter
MPLFEVIAILVTLTAAFSYLNHRYVHLHPSVGVTIIALGVSLLLMVLEKLGLPVKGIAAEFLRNIHLDQALLQWMLGFLLFGGAMGVDLNELSRQRGLTALLAIAGTIASMFIVGWLMWGVLRGVGLALPLKACLLFGALISPTDPVAVVSLMKWLRAPKSLQTLISGESLFNDGIGVVLFLTLVGINRGDGNISAISVTWLFVRQAFGGAVLGFFAGAIVYQLLRRAHNFQVEVLLTVALVMGSYALAERINVSAPITAVVAGLLIGNHGRVFDLAERTRRDLEQFWVLAEEVLNAVLFVLIGLEILVTPFTGRLLVAIAMAIPIVLFARWLSVLLTISVLSRGRRLRRAMMPILTWGGLRGGLAVAMALSLSPSARRDTLVAITYGVVVFSIIVQGTTIGRVVKRYIATVESDIAARELV